MKSFKHIFPSLFFALVLVYWSGCDIIDPEDRIEVVDPGGGGGTDSTTTGLDSTRTVLIEDFTGHGCGNCPRAHEKIESISPVFGEQIVVIGIHSGFFARTDVWPELTTDFTSPIGTAIDDHFEADEAGFPKGLINRQEFNGQTLQDVANWSTAINTSLGEPSTVAMGMDVSYDASSREVDVTVDLNYIQNGSATENLVVVITEDSLISPQKDYSTTGNQVIDDYVHRHMLRSSVTPGLWGESLKAGLVVQGESFSRDYQFTLPAEWNDKKCYVVAWVADNSTKEIRKAMEKHIEVE